MSQYGQNKNCTKIRVEIISLTIRSVFHYCFSVLQSFMSSSKSPDPPISLLPFKTFPRNFSDHHQIHPTDGRLSKCVRDVRQEDILVPILGRILIMKFALIARITGQGMQIRQTIVERHLSIRRRIIIYKHEPKIAIFPLHVFRQKNRKSIFEENRRRKIIKRIHQQIASSNGKGHFFRCHQNFLACLDPIHRCGSIFKKFT